MKNFLLTLLLIMASVLNTFAQPKTGGNSFNVTIKTNRIDPKTKAYLVYQFEGNKYFDSVMLKEANFKFTGQISQPVNAVVIFDNAGQGLKTILKRKFSTVDALRFYIHPGNIVITADQNIADATFALSSINKDNYVLQQRLKAIYLQQVLISEKLVAETDTNRLKAEERTRDSLEDARVPILKAFIIQHPDSYISLVAVQDYERYLLGKDNYALSVTHLAEIERMLSMLSADQRNTILGKQMAYELASMKTLKVGAPAPDFMQPDVDDQPVRLSQFKGKYVLLDFWASWCGPCRQNNPAMVQLYHDFKDRNFTILGISLDDKAGKADWLKAIKDDGLEWLQVSDLKHWSNQVVKLYSVTAIPESILIGPDGRIAAKGLSPDELRTKLNELLPPAK
jgi:peroxiredoxin